MGSYSNFRVGNRELYSVKNDIDPLLMSLFRPEDKVVRQVTSSELESIDIDYDPAGDDKVLGSVQVVQYVSTVGVLRDRLDLMGFTLRFAKAEFDKGLKERLEKELDKFEWYISSESLQTACTEALENLTFESWSAAFSRIWNEKLENTIHLVPNGEPAILYGQPIDLILVEGREFHSFPTYDTRVFLRAAFEVIDPNTEVIQDLTDLILGGWFDSTSDLCEHADYLVTADFATTQRIIVLTEGPSDKKALQGALSVLCPHLTGYFTFMDFEQMNVPGGAGSLVSFVKAFVAAGIINRIVAVFDNDTAAQSALRALRGLRLPPNVRVIRYPDIDIAKTYPTIGPTGVIQMDVNGLAGSVELYFGEDVLKRLDGSYVPIQWRGFDQAVGQYQGEIMDKADLQARFQEKVIQCLNNSNSQNNLDWSGMTAVLRTLCSAFHDCGPLGLDETS